MGAALAFLCYGLVACEVAGDDAQVTTSAADSTSDISVSGTDTTTSNTTSSTDTPPDCEGFTDAAACEAAQCVWISPVSYPDVKSCEKIEMKDRAGCFSAAPHAVDFPVTYVDVSGGLFDTIGSSDGRCEANAARGVSWQPCTLAQSGAPGCACGWIAGVSAAQRAAEATHACGFDEEYTIEIPEQFTPDFDVCDETTAKQLFSTLAQGKRVHLELQELGSFHSVYRHIYGIAGQQARYHENFFGDVQLCVEESWMRPETCLLAPPSYFQEKLDAGTSLCFLLERAHEELLWQCEVEFRTPDAACD